MTLFLLACAPCKQPQRGSDMRVWDVGVGRLRLV